MGLFNRGNSIAEYALPTTIGVLILIGSIATFHAEIASLFGQTLNSEKGAAGVTARPYSTLVDPNSVVLNFDDAYTRGILDRMEIKCSNRTGVCLQTTKGLDGIETSGAVGTKRFLDKQLRRIMMAFDDLLDQPGNESLKAKFRDLADVGYQIAELQRRLARAIKRGDTAKVAELIAQLNGGSVTYRVDNGDGTYTLTTITGDQSGSLIDQLRQLRTEIMNDPRLAAIAGGKEALDALYSVLEYDALSTSTLVNGPPPSGDGTTMTDAVKSGSGDTSGSGQVVQQTTTGGATSTSAYNINNIISLVNSDPALAAQLTSLATQEAAVKNDINTASSAYGDKSDEAADIITKAAKVLANDPDFATASPEDREDMLKDLLDDWEDGDNKSVDKKTAEKLLKDVGDGGSITNVFLSAAQLEADKKELTTQINNTLLSNNTYSDEKTVGTVVDTATSDSTVLDSMTSGDTNTVAEAVEDTKATNTASNETESAASTTEENSNTSCKVGDGTTQTGDGASSCIG